MQFRLPALRGRLQTASLFALDGLANFMDFAFHFWMARVLFPAEYAILQTLNSVLLVYVTATGLFQPVVGRFVAEARALGNEEAVPAIFQAFLRAALLLGLIFSVLVLSFSRGIGALLDLPVWSIQVCGALMVLTAMRPVGAGVLQGLQRFTWLGLTRIFTSSGRIVAAAVLLRAGFGLQGAVVAFPVGWAVGVLAALLSVGMVMWKKREHARGILRRAGTLSGFALIAYLAYMSLMSMDLVWINRSLSGELAGAYSGLVLLRRVIALLPGVAVVIMLPRVAAALAQGKSPVKLLVRTSAFILATSGALTLVYGFAGERIILALFGEGYRDAIPWAGWMGLAMTGLSLSAVWLNYYLVERPASFVILLLLAVGAEWAMLSQSTASIRSAILAFGIAGWGLAVSGLVLYLTRAAAGRIGPTSR